MSDLISRAALFNRLANVKDIGEAFAVIQGMPAEEIPRCKNCYWWTKQDDSLQGRCARYGFYPTGYWYCAAARERRDDG